MLFLHWREGMKVIKHTFPEHPELAILPLADWHIGDPNADGKRMLEWLDYLKNNPNAYAILNGDLMDAAIKTSIGDVYQASIQPMEQLKQCVKLFEPVKGKILAVTDGNHERRISRNDNISLTEIMCQQLGIGDLYCPTAVLLFIRVGQMSSQKHNLPVCYTIYCSHGAGGGGRTAGGKINRLVDMAAIVDADIYIMSHVHQPAVLRTAYYRVSASNSSVQKVDKLFINTSAALNYGGYGELALYRPASTQTPLLFLNGRRKEATATL